MRKYVYVEKPVLDQVNVSCDKCGKEIHPNDDYLEINHFWGYGTPIDGVRWLFDLCYDCCELIFKDVKKDNFAI